MDLKEPRIAGSPQAYPVKLVVHSDNRAGMLKQITAVIGDDNTNISNISSQSNNGVATIEIVVEISDVGHLNKIITGLRKIAGVRDVQRVQKLPQ